MAGVRATIFEDSIVIEEGTLVSYKYVQTVKEVFFFSLLRKIGSYHIPHYKTCFSQFERILPTSF